jgi:pimeloyl-ACP methyl ester carboxylesterase
VEIAEHTAEVAGLAVHIRQAGDAPILYLHGVPTHSWDWIPFLERFGGSAPDLPGFGRSAKPADF